MNPFLEILRERIVIFDGAMGTNLQNQHLTPDDYGGEKYSGCNEYLLISNPMAVEKVHDDFLSAGSDVIETNSFGATSVVLSEYGISEKAFELNFRAASLAKKIADDYSASGRKRFVAGSMGPTTKLPSLGHIGFKTMEEAYYIQAKGLVSGGADVLIVETCQDLLQAKTALAGIFKYFFDARIKIPVIVSVTVEAQGSMLLGTEISAALTTLDAFDISMIGINCATGPKEMSESVRYLCASSLKPVLVMPNAGIPENFGGVSHYPLTPEELSKYLVHFIKDLGVSAAGGCCGTSKEHIRQLAEKVGSMAPQKRNVQNIPGCSSLYQSVPFRIDRPPVLIGEKTNANGSRQFRNYLINEDWDGMVGMGKEQVSEGAHILDVCSAYVGRDESRDMSEIIRRLNTQVSVPLMIDSTEPHVIEIALQNIAGKAVVNSVNLEDGGEKLRKTLSICRKYGAAVIALAIDESGMAKTAGRKLEIAGRIRNIAVKEFGLNEHDIIFDMLTFTLASGDEEFRGSAKETINAIRQIKAEFPLVQTILGVSNVSFGLVPATRQILNSVFLHYAIEAGLDLAIVNASKILPLYKIREDERELCRKIIFDERSTGYDPLQDIITRYSSRKEDFVQAAPEELSIEERLKKRIIDGNKVGLSDDLEGAMKSLEPIDIINNILLEGMKTVGELFGGGQMQLPFVLQSAEVMKASVKYLEPYLEKSGKKEKGTLVLATVKGDVHDIGKNLVDIILSNNGFKVVNLGIQCPVEKIINAADAHGADAIGMSGLLVKSTQVMKENLEIFNERNVSIPVILGGAALTRGYVEEDLRKIYRGFLGYARDAFDGLLFMDDLQKTVDKKETSFHGSGTDTVPDTDAGPTGFEAKIVSYPKQKSSHALRQLSDHEIPKPPFYGSKLVTGIELDRIFPYINETALIRGQWSVKKKKLTEKQYGEMLDSEINPVLQELKARTVREKLLQPKVVYGYFPCHSDGDRLKVYDIDKRSLLPDSGKIIAEFSFPRQTADRNLCLSDYFLPAGSPGYDVVAFQIVTMGEVATRYSRELFRHDDYKGYLYFHGFSVEATEALAEYWHKIIRAELSIDHNDARDIKKLFGQQYQGARFSLGYPSCPSLEDQEIIFALLDPGRIGIELTEGFQLVPEQSTSAIIVHHPEARYFNI